MTDPLGPIVVTSRDIYDELVRMRQAVDRLVDRHDVLERESQDHEARIRSLERGRWPLPSIATLVAIASLIVAAIALSQPS